MLFNSYNFVLWFFASFIILYFVSNRINIRAGRLVMILGGLFFYSFGGLESLAVLFVSMVINFGLSWMIKRSTVKRKKVLYFVDIAANVGLLLYFKYLNFFLDSIYQICNGEYTAKDIILPLGVSFFTFQQIMYAAEVYNGEIQEISVGDYLVYILYFPKIIMGPLTSPREFIGQLHDEWRKKANADNILSGVVKFSFGLFKKMVLADTFAIAVNWGFDNMHDATAIEVILVMMFYTFQIYFDFSGYTDMAVAVSKMMNFDLPQNFNMPYRAVSIRDFWKRWHMSLTGFLTKYVYIPLGGSKKGKARTYINTVAVFLISGLWHGANWTFVLWGAFHGVLSVLERMGEGFIKRLPLVVRWVGTWIAINILWLLFRADSVGQWLVCLKRMTVWKGLSLREELISCFVLPEQTFIINTLHLGAFESHIPGFPMVVFILVGFCCSMVKINFCSERRSVKSAIVIAAAVAMSWSILCLGRESMFLYFNF